jgi:hypothetical protein
MLESVGLVSSALWTDVDDDGWLDLLVAVEWGGVVFLRNLKGRGFEDVSAMYGFADAGNGWWSSLAAADFNGDGRLDFAAGNLGLNTQYQASEEEPSRLYLVQTRSRPGFRMVEAYFEDGVMFPRRTKSELAREFRWVREAFRTNSQFASASLEAIMGSERLAAAERLEAREFRSGVFLSQSDGRYRFSTLPRLAQVGPIHGMVAGDFDGDGQADLVALHNSRAPVPVVGRFYGGLGVFLRGDGDGGFMADTAADSGIIVPGDARALAVIDLDRNGWPDLVATRNPGKALILENGTRPGRRSFSIALEGDAGNPNAIGARVTVVLSDGRIESSEIHAGSGYMSQSTPALFFGYPDGNPPQKVRVRWPSGQETEHEFPSITNRMRLSPGGFILP